MPRTEKLHSHLVRSSPYSVSLVEPDFAVPLQKEKSSDDVPAPLECSPSSRDPFDDDWETIQYLRERETQFIVGDNFLSRQTEIDYEMRATLINWLYDVVSELRFTTVTWFLTVNYIDRFCESKFVTRGKYQLVGITCFFIAMKFEEKNPISYRHLAVLADNAYTPDEILFMESEIIDALDFDLSVPSSVDFISFLLKHRGGDFRVAQLSHYLAELSVLEKELVTFRSSMISLATVIIAMNYFGIEWDAGLGSLLDCDLESNEFLNCLQLVGELWNSPSRETTPIFSKYSRPEFGEVARLSPSLMN